MALGFWNGLRWALVNQQEYHPLRPGEVRNTEVLARSQNTLSTLNSADGRTFKTSTEKRIQV